MSDPSPTGGPAAPSANLRLLFGPIPSYRVHVWGWLKAPAQRLLMPDWLAITIGNDIFAWRALDDAELGHELVHVRQWRANGVAYIWRYYQASNAAQKAGLDRYRANSFEVEAYAAADAIRAGHKVILGAVDEGEASPTPPDVAAQPAPPAPPEPPA
jgi:hypothetical protein